MDRHLPNPQRSARRAQTALAPAARARTVADWATVWLRDYARPAISTRRNHATATRRIVADAGPVRLDRIDRPAARRYAQDWPNGTTRIARSMWADAVRDGVAAYNPFTGLRLEQPKGRKDLTALTEPEIHALADAAVAALGDYGPEFRAIILALGYVGCRPGELCCLHRTDIDTDRGEVHVQRSLDGQGGEKLPKNGRARTVIIPPPALQAIGTYPARIDSPYLFHTRTGQRLSKGSLAYAFRQVRQRWAGDGGRDHVEPYELRHSAATLLVHRGLPQHVVAHQLGHEDGGALVARLYGHPEEGRMRDQIRLAFGDHDPAAEVLAAEKRRTTG